VYFSFTVQSLVGLAQPSTINEQGLQIWIMVQSFIGYLVVIGVVIILIKFIHKHKNLKESMSKKI
jgi:hypothetical protein